MKPPAAIVATLFVASFSSAAEKVVTENGISFSYDDATFPEQKTLKEEKVTAQQIRDDTIVFWLGPEYPRFLLRDQRPLPAFEKGPRYLSPTQSRVEVIPLFDATVPDFAKAYPSLPRVTKALGNFLDRSPKTVPWIKKNGDYEITQRVGVPDILYYNSSPAFQVRLRYFENESIRGVFFLSQYTQEWPVWPNHEQTGYFFHGLSKDGRYAIVAEFAVTHPSIPVGIDTVPERVKTGKVTEREVKAAVTKLAAQRDDSFTPKLPELRKIIASLRLPKRKDTGK